MIAPHSVCPGFIVCQDAMFPFPTYGTGNYSFQSELDSTLTRGGPSGLAYSEANKYALKKQLLETNEVRQRLSRITLPCVRGFEYSTALFRVFDG